LDIDAASGVMEPARALRHIESGLAEAFRASSMPAGDQLESWGWWAIFGCNIALRHLPIERSNDQIARLHLHLHAASERLENWAFRAKAFGIELQRREHARQAGLDLEAWRLTPKQMENLVHTMGRLPAFQATGWRILTEFGVLERANRIDPRTWRKGLIEV
jgi:predicted GNAT superfamily acetyltransferase